MSRVICSMRAGSLRGWLVDALANHRGTGQLGPKVGEFDHDAGVRCVAWGSNVRGQGRDRIPPAGVLELAAALQLLNHA